MTSILMSHADHIILSPKEMLRILRREGLDTKLPCLS